MPRAGQGSGGGSRGGSGHGSGRMGSGHRPSGGGSGRRAGGGGPSGFGGFGGGTPSFGGGHGGAPGRGPRRPYSNGSVFGDLISDIVVGAASYQAGKNAGRREAARNQYPYGSAPGSMGAPPQPGAGGPGMPPTGPNRNGKVRSGIWATIILAVLVVFLIVLFVPSCSGSGSTSSSAGSVPASTYNRTKLDSGVAYDKDCIDDELGWFSNVSSAESRLKTFYDKTGIQPYILFAAYNASLSTDAQKLDWAKQWYDQHIDNEDTLLFVYFAERDTDNDVGYMALIPGRNTESIMDSQAQDIFWSYLDQYWYSDMSTDDAIVTTFDKTADRIMTKTTTQQDVNKWLVIALIVIVVVAAIIVILVIRARRKREHEAYVERMVTTPLEEAEDPLLKKYVGDATDGTAGTDRQH